ncbi:DNA-directed RNA polymerases I [Mitosporidium daphniae]|uniref:Subunit RpaBC4 of DNA-directed RNA polymerase I/II/III n=1 Tax=Mitosporidium daphniae TaxID=1485682 RepID=A0A098VMS7_9MICR|nr:subunit RpaBC4 of DNA-directed RNA polymerase I/II/III [Mitosporidium daphniae]KGG50270.1 subunit RpaBC4 of DNA-directed RNA polymerase I/II/III [Mitosporidium daphniae]|eukprot:XP_013236697.1 subunit RpaBC4 of DNA-directed RNA polymerase I/II/III [Mitosporidium daphniae]
MNNPPSSFPDQAAGPISHSSARPNLMAPPMKYICGGILGSFILECCVENELRPKDAIRCKECGYRIMYKKRTSRVGVSESSLRRI